MTNRSKLEEMTHSTSLEVINNSMAYTYHLYHIPTNRNYYGVRYAKNSHPSDLWVSYFSSSNEIGALINEYGISSFIPRIRKIFDDPYDAILWETKLLHKIDAKNNPLWINRHNGDGKFSSYGSMPIYQRQQISAANKGRQLRGIGWHHSTETIIKITQGNTGKHSGPISDQHKNNISLGMTTTLSGLSPDQKKERMLNSCCSPESYTVDRSQKISDALKGKHKSKEHKDNISKSKKEAMSLMTSDERKAKFGRTLSSEEREKLSLSKKESIAKLTHEERKERFGKLAGKTWRVVDGKRVWSNKEI
jgi:hypothetical protein